MRVAIYVRVSSAEQRKGHSLEDQSARLTEWAEREGWSIAATYEDPGVTATSVRKRAGFLHMLEDAGAGRFDRVLVKKRDRYARNMGDAAEYQRRLARMGVTVWSLEEPATNTDTPEGFLARGFADLLAEYYSVELSHKTTQGWERRALNGLPAGDIPFGYISNPDDPRNQPPVVIPEEAEAVRSLFVSYAAGGKSMRDMANELSALGFHPRSKRGKDRFSKAGVERILANPFYVGDILYKGSVVSQGRHDPIVERDLFEQVRERRRLRAAYPQRPATRRVYLLAGVGRCALCSGPLWANSSRSYHYYRCAASARGEQCTVRAGVLADGLEEQVGQMFRRMDLPDDWQDLVYRMAAGGPDEGAIEMQREALLAKKKRIQNLYIGGMMDEADVRRELVEVQEAIGSLPARASAVSDCEWALNIPEMWPDMAQDERRDLVLATIDHVAVDVEAGVVEAFQPRPHLASLFAVALGSTVCAWRPRTDSGRQSTNGWIVLAA